MFNILPGRKLYASLNENAISHCESSACCRIGLCAIISRISLLGGFIVPGYELVFILNANLSEDDFTRVLGKVNDQITKLGGTITETNQWGKRRLAYPIKKQAEGNYVLEKVQIKQTALKELDANLKMSEDVLRYLFVRENS
jgi:small subunit ribosomal protein S6